MERALVSLSLSTLSLDEVWGTTWMLCPLLRLPQKGQAVLPLWTQLLQLHRKSGEKGKEANFDSNNEGKGGRVFALGVHEGWTKK